MRDATPVLYGLLHKAFVKKRKITIIVEGVEFRCLLWRLGGSSFIPGQQMVEVTVQAFERPKIRKAVKRELAEAKAVRKAESRAKL